MAKIITLFMLSSISFLTAELPYEVIYYCEERIDEISYTLTHRLEKDQDERKYLLGQFDAYSEIIHLLEVNTSD